MRREWGPVRWPGDDGSPRYFIGAELGYPKLGINAPHRSPVASLRILSARWATAILPARDPPLLFSASGNP